MASMQRQQSPLLTPTQEARAQTSTTESHTSPQQTETTIPQNTAAPADAQSSQTPPRFLSADDDPSVRKCWICFSDSTEDTAETSSWRNPCPCALVAHEECLLDWIADVEGPKNSTRGGITAPQILCPQCKSEIKLARPRSYVVELVKLLDRSAARLVMPGGVVIFSVDLLYKLSFAHGIHSIYRIFGTADADRILRPIMQNWMRPPIDFDQTLPEIRDRALISIAHHVQHWRLYLGLPLITPMLLLSRTTWHFSEALLTVLPTLFFALQPSAPGEVFSFAQWPPSASMAFALLPYARQAYNLSYERMWGEKVRRWKKEVLPTTSQAQVDAAPAQDAVQAIEDAAEDANVFEIRVDGGIWEEWEEEAPAGEAQPEPPEAAAAAPNIPRERPQLAQPDAAQPAAQGQAVQAERRLSFSPASVAENVLGALAFPTVAEISGELLRLALPKAWTSSPAATLAAVGSRLGLRVGAKGMLHEKWGRSLIGGCLFVVFKDALLLYVRWKMAQMHRNRRVLDYDHSKARTTA